MLIAGGLSLGWSANALDLRRVTKHCSLEAVALERLPEVMFVHVEQVSSNFSMGSQIEYLKVIF